MKVTSGIKAGALHFASATIGVVQVAGALSVSAVLRSGNHSGGGASSASEAIAANSSNNTALAIA
jgi:hypothetical protein